MLQDTAANSTGPLGHPGTTLLVFFMASKPAVREHSNQFTLECIPFCIAPIVASDDTCTTAVATALYKLVGLPVIFSMYNAGKSKLFIKMTQIKWMEGSFKMGWLTLQL
jgi:hypothetical protein